MLLNKSALLTVNFNLIGANVGSVEIMATSRECICCCEIDGIVEKQENASEIACITDHEVFQSVCLDVWLLIPFINRDMEMLKKLQFMRSTKLCSEENQAHISISKIYWI